MPMTKTDARELKSIVKGRFEILRQQATMREHELRNHIRNEVLEENRDKIERYRQAVDDLNRRAKELGEDLTDLTRKAEDDGIQIGRRRVMLDVDASVAPANLEHEVLSRLQEVLTETGYRKTNLSMLELDILERLALSTLESEEAREFLDRIPKIEELIPLPSGNGHKQLLP